MVDYNAAMDARRWQALGLAVTALLILLFVLLRDLERSMSEPLL